MNWEAAGALGEIMGAIAVVATLLFLQRQIRDMRRSEFSGVLDRIVLVEIEILKMEKDASDLIDRGDRSEDLTESERFAVSRILMA